MKQKKAGHTPGPVEIAELMAEEAYWNALENTIESASAELDWSDTSDSNREKAEIGAAVLMLSAPELLNALVDLQNAVREYRLLDAKKRWRLCTAEAQATTAIYKATGGK